MSEEKDRQSGEQQRQEPAAVLPQPVVAATPPKSTVPAAVYIAFVRFPDFRSTPLTTEKEFG
jgi:hypothetical protein